MKTQIKILIAICFSAYSTMIAQNVVIREKITKTYDLVNSKKSIIEFQKREGTSRLKAFRTAESQNIPTSGIAEGGNYFELQGIDNRGTLIYYTTRNSGSRATARVNDISTGGILGLKLDGDKMVVGVWDGRPALDTHIEFIDNQGNSRVILKNAIPSLENKNSNWLAEFEESRFHGTHVTGTIAAQGTTLKAKGIAPKAEIWAYDWKYDILEMSVAAQEGLLVSNHSYGIAAIDDQGQPLVPDYYFGSYSGDAIRIDSITNKYKYYQPVIAAGNDRSYYSLINPSKKGNDLLLGSSLSKNSIVVAAVSEVNNYVDASSVTMSSFSSYGPTNDFRIKPDISAKGVNVYSTSYSNPMLPNAISSEPKNNSYNSVSGTSMASPAVSGVVALWQQWGVENNTDGLPFKSATIRAIMSHTADEAGSAPGPDHRFGWGLINAKKGVETMIASKENSVLLEENTLSNGVVYTKKFILNESGDKLIATIAWTDVEAKYNNNFFDDSQVFPTLINDLDIVITKGDGTEFFPWRLNPDFNDIRAEKGVNDVDNIEKVEIENADSGEYTITVSHKGSLVNLSQEFTLVVSSEKSNNLDIEETKIEDTSPIKIWPNPMNDVLNVEIPANYLNSNLDYRIYDITGKMIIKGTESSANSFQVYVGDLSKGVYIIEIKKEGLKTVIEKIIKK